MEMEFKVLHLIMLGIAFHLELNLKIFLKCGPIFFLFVKQKNINEHTQAAFNRMEIV